MKTPSWKRAKQVFSEAVGKTGPERRRLVVSRCGGDSELLAGVEGLLKAHDEAGGFLAEVTAAPDHAFGTERFLSLQSHLAGRYSFEGELGRGGMGIVYLAKDVSLDRPVAIKLLATDLGGRIDVRQRFLEEARTSAGLSHPNIVPVHSVEDHGDLVFFVMAYVDGETVRERVSRSGPLSVGEASRMLQQVAWALDHAHGRGIVHRDVKPDNIMLETASGRAVVTDFGIAQAGTSSSVASGGRFLGTPGFVSPEQALGREVDGRSDVYSLGVTSFFALTGHLPCEEGNGPGTRTLFLRESASSVTAYRPDVPRKLAQAIDGCLAIDPDDRFASAEELARAASEARDQVKEESAAVQEVRTAAESLVLDGLGFGTLSAMVGLEVLRTPSGPDVWGFGEVAGWGIRLVVWLLTIDIIGSRLVQLVRRSRHAIRQGHSIQHLCDAVPKQAWRFGAQRGIDWTGILRAALVLGAFGAGFSVQHRGDVLSRLAPGSDSRPAAGELGTPRVLLEVGAFLLSLEFLAIAWAIAWGWEAGDLGLSLTLVVLAMHMFLILLPLLVGRMIGASLIGRWPVTQRVWTRIWQGRVGRWLFRFAGAGLDRDRKPTPSTRPTETRLAGTVADLFDSLPIEYQARLEGLPDLVVRLEEAVGLLRRREIELEQALVSAGTLGSTGDRQGQASSAPTQPSDFGSLRAHLTTAREELVSARKVVRERTSSAVAALEHLRLGLLRLRAGAASPDELTADLSAAKELGLEVRALLDGEREVEGLLEQPGGRTGFPSPPNSESA